ncbi:FHA domain-containing protein, partial [Acinetobacter baumannii]
MWVVDENSSNGTFVNGEKVPPAGKALKDGDSILLGNNTTVKILFSVNKSVTAGSAQISSNPSPSPKPSLIGLLPALLIGLALTI